MEVEFGMKGYCGDYASHGEWLQGSSSAVAVNVQQLYPIVSTGMRMLRHRLEYAQLEVLQGWRIQWQRFGGDEVESFRARQRSTANPVWLVAWGERSSRRS